MRVRLVLICCIWLTSACSDVDAAAAADSCAPGAIASPRDYPDGGACDDSEPARVAEHALIKRGYALTCESQALDATGCEGVPNDIWGRCSTRRCEAKVGYPEGCVVWLPTQNPYYPGSAQSCTCAPSVQGTKLRWLCGL
jgi:hypothetical protein